MLIGPLSPKADINRGLVLWPSIGNAWAMANRMVTCPMTSRDTKWSRLSHISIISSQNKRLQLPCKYNWNFEKWDHVSQMSRICRPCLGYVSVTTLTNRVLQLKPAIKQQISMQKKFHISDNGTLKTVKINNDDSRHFGDMLQKYIITIFD